MKGSFRLSMPGRLSCSVLIVGSGAGGSAVADVLTRAGVDVLMLEEGPMAGPAAAAASIGEGMHKYWRTGGLGVALGSVPVAYAEGRCVGGGTEINSGIMQRTPPALLDEWAERYCIESFGASALAPHFDRVFYLLHASLTPGSLGEHSDLLKRGADALGWKVSALERAQRTCVGTNMCASLCPTGGKQSMSVTLLPEALLRGLRLVSDCRVTQLVLAKGCVKGAIAEARDAHGRRLRLVVDAESVFVCAGAVHTPALLRRSGITHNVGNTLRMHPTVKVLGRFPHDISAFESRLPLYAITEFMPHLRLGGSICTPGTFGLALAEDWENREAMLPDLRHFAMYYAMVRSSARGTIRNLPNVVEPLVRYQIEDADWTNLQEGARRMAELMFEMGATHVLPPAGGAPCTSLHDDRFALSTGASRRSTSVMSIHLFGSCPIGDRRELTAADSSAQVWGVRNLFVADASAIPEAPGVNPQATAMAMAYRSADRWVAAQSTAHTSEAIPAATLH